MLHPKSAEPACRPHVQPTQKVTCRRRFLRATKSHFFGSDSGTAMEQGVVEVTVGGKVEIVPIASACVRVGSRLL